MAWTTLDFTAFQTLTATQLDQMYANMAGLKNGTLFDNDAIPAAAINFGGSGSGVWWEEIGRTTLGSAGDTISVSSLPARAHLKIIFLGLQSGVILPHLRFNNDSSSNYNYRYLLNYATAGGGVSQTTITLDPASTANDVMAEVYVTNSSSQEKLVKACVVGRGGSGAANQATSFEVSAKWANTSAAISRVDIFNSGGAGDFAAGSVVIVLGHD
jgi:hypothetical protein